MSEELSDEEKPSTAHAARSNLVADGEAEIALPVKRRICILRVKFWRSTNEVEIKSLPLRGNFSQYPAPAPVAPHEAFQLGT